MTHYRQIIVNISVDDDTPEEEMEELKADFEAVAKDEYKNREFVKEITVRLN